MGCMNDESLVTSAAIRKYCVTREIYWQITPHVIKNIVIHGNPYIILYLFEIMAVIVKYFFPVSMSYNALRKFNRYVVHSYIIHITVLYHDFIDHNTVKPVYNDHLMGYFSVFWSSSRWPRAT